MLQDELDARSNDRLIILDACGWTMDQVRKECRRRLDNGEAVDMVDRINKTLEKK